MDERPKKAKGKSRLSKDTAAEAAEPVAAPTLVVASPEPSVAPESPDPTAPKKASKKSKGFLSTLFGGGDPE